MKKRKVWRASADYLLLLAPCHGQNNTQEGGIPSRHLLMNGLVVTVWLSGLSKMRTCVDSGRTVFYEQLMSAINGAITFVIIKKYVNEGSSVNTGSLTRKCMCSSSVCSEKEGNVPFVPSHIRMARLSFY